jgi:hypothetical protein
MRRLAALALTAAMVVAACGSHDSLDSTSTSAITPPTSEAASSTTAPEDLPPGGGDLEAGEPTFPIPDESSILETDAWGEVFDRRVLIRLADDAGIDAASPVAEALGGTVVASVDEFLIVEIELPQSGESAIVDALAIAESRDDVLIAAPSGVIRPDWEATERPCGPLDSLELQHEGYLDQYQLIGVEDAWRLVRGSGVAITPPIIGQVDGFGAPDYHGQWVHEVIDGGGSVPGILDAIIGDGSFGYQPIEIFGSSAVTSAPNRFDAIAKLIKGPPKATVINLSLGRDGASPESVAMEAEIFRTIAERYPDVLMVASAGNAGDDVSAHLPGGLELPNLITVGGLDHDGDTWFETWVEGGVVQVGGSNFVADGGEVSLAVIAQDVFVGMTEGGTPKLGTGTSFAAPQVTAAAALLKALDPTLEAADIKRILVNTAATEIPDPAGGTKAVDPAVGGRVLRIDEAVWRVLERRLGVTATRNEIMARATLDAKARQMEDEPLDYRITATAAEAGDPSAPFTTIRIDVNGSGQLSPGRDTLSTDEGVARWHWLFFQYGESALVTLTRLDTGACARLAITAAEPEEPEVSFTGRYQGTFEWSVPEYGFGRDVPFTARVRDDSRITFSYDWSGVFDYGEGIEADMSLSGSCGGTVDDQGSVDCSGDFLGRSVLFGITTDTTGTFSVEAAIDGDGAMLGSLVVVNDLGQTGVFELAGERVGG